MALYRRAGAKYFVALGNHHDNFDCWDSKFQPWNSVNIGPHKDIIGIWAKVARQYGLRFGVSVHAARAWDWFDVSHGADKTGPLKGVPYDGNLTGADGKGRWWEAYDPVQLYDPGGIARTPQAHQAYVDKFFNRTKDLIDKYQPDLVYFEDYQLPLGDTGLAIAAYYYNSNLEWHHGNQQAVITCNALKFGVRKALVMNRERRVSYRIDPYPYQTATCIGGWHYCRSTYTNHSYATVEDVVKMLVDAVSKNGNLLLSIPMRGDGTIDDDEIKFLEGMTKWMDVNGECIYGTRPWGVFGERTGGVKPSGGINEDSGRYTYKDIRFTTKRGAVYAIVLGWPPDGRLIIHSLAETAKSATKVTRVVLLGHEGDLKFEQNAGGLMVTMPVERPCDHAFTFKITGEHLVPVTSQ